MKLYIAQTAINNLIIDMLGKHSWIHAWNAELMMQNHHIYDPISVWTLL